MLVGLETADSSLLFVLPPTSHFVPPLTSLSNTTKNPAAVVNLPIGINLQRGKNLVGEVQGGEREQWPLMVGISVSCLALVSPKFILTRDARQCPCEEEILL